MSLIISGGKIIDGIADQAVDRHSIWVEGERIRAIGLLEELDAPPSAQMLDVQGKYVVPGLMNANVHLLAGIFLPGNLLRYFDRLEDLAIEAAQVALKNGLTTVFDTIGPRLPLTRVRERINAGDVVGSRLFCAGWMVGLDGIFSLDFNVKAGEVLGNAWIERVNSICAENVGPALSWMSPEHVGREVRDYIAKGIDFIKYASSEHRWGDPTTSLVFSPRAQEAIVLEAHRAGLTAQAHTSSVESLRVAIEAGCDLIQHCNITGPVPIPDETLELFLKRSTGAVVFPFTQKRLEWIQTNCEVDRVYHATSDINCRNLLQCGASLLLANDGALWGPDILSDGWLSKSWLVPGEDDLNALDQGHFVWMKAMEEKGMAPIDILRAATRNIAIAYGIGRDYGTIETGKIADMLVLDQDPLQSTENFRSIRTVIKSGNVVDIDALPANRILTQAGQSPSEELVAYRKQRSRGRGMLPPCPACFAN